MRLFKTHDPVRSVEDEAAAVRLMAIANRCKVGRSPDLTAEALPDSPEAPDVPEILQ
jgi:hypothetical protein